MLKDKEVEVRWHSLNKKYYEDKGYIYTKMKDPFLVKVEDLPHGSGVQVKAYCDYCGNEYGIKYGWYYKSITTGIKKCACQKCHGKKAHEAHLQERAQKHFDKLRKVCDDLGYTLITEQKDFTDTDMEIQYICPIHGIQTQVLETFLLGHYCRPCSYEKRASDKKRTEEEIIRTIESVNGNTLLNPWDYTNAFNKNLQVRCQCGQVFTVSYDNYRSGSTIRCKSCTNSESNGEYYVRDYLEKNTIKYIPQYKFDDCKDVRTLPFDFFIPEWNLAIEFDGEQHFINIFGEDSLKKTQYHDEIKNNYCKTNGIDLIRIPYWERNNISQVLDKELQKYR